MSRLPDQELLNRPQPPNPASSPFVNPEWDDVTPAGLGRENGAIDPAVTIDANPEPTSPGDEKAGESAVNAIPFPATNDSFTSNSDAVGEEQQLMTTIGELWSSTRTTESTIKRSRKKLAEVRHDLGLRLNAYKNLLSRAGCGGQWAGFLRENEIPRAIADRLVGASGRSSAETVNRLSEAISAPTEVDIANIVSGLKPRLARQLTTPELVDRFLHALRDALQEAVSARG